mmetsp:Transcript_26128/g.22881  ORF Transcript_26128/g.22881 Transcript_26128/m.22881 type:complete len:81 (-) Transcript_26128:223-465(-)
MNQNHPRRKSTNPFDEEQTMNKDNSNREIVLNEAENEPLQYDNCKVTMICTFILAVLALIFCLIYFGVGGPDWTHDGGAH